MGTIEAQRRIVPRPKHVPNPVKQVVTKPAGLMRYHGQRTVVVAMVSMWMMQATVDQVIDVVAVRDGLMPAVRAVLMC